MNERSENFYEIRRKIRASMSVDELIQQIGVIEQLAAEDLLHEVFDGLLELTEEDAIKGKELIFSYLLPYLERDEKVFPCNATTLWQLRNCLVRWFDQYPEVARYALRERVIDEIRLKLRLTHSQSICWTLAHIGFRKPNVVDVLWDTAQNNNDEVGDTALATIVALGVSLGERPRILEVLHQRAIQRMNQPLISALYQLADPSSLPVVQSAWLQADDVQESIRDRSLALQVLTNIADRVESEEIQGQIWQIIVDLYEPQPERFPFDIRLSGDLIVQCNSSKVIPTVLNWISQEETPWNRYQFYRRSANCVRPRQLQSWRQSYTPPMPQILHQDACQDTQFAGQSKTREMYIKKAAWTTALRMGYGGMLNWFREGVSAETNRYLRREICDLFACFRLDSLPVDVLQWVTETYDADTKDATSAAELVARMGAIEMAHSAASQEAFNALLVCGLTVEGQSLRASVKALEDVALTLARVGNLSVVETLVEVATSHQESRYRTAAGNALEVLAAEGLLSVRYTSQIITTLIEHEERDAFERSMLVAVLGYLDANELPSETIYHLQQWASNRSDQLGTQSLIALAQLDQLINQKDLLVMRLGLQPGEKGWHLSSGMRYSGWAGYVIGQLYLQHPQEFLPAVVSLLKTQDWAIVAQILGQLEDIYGGQDHSPVPEEIADALIERIHERQTRVMAELELFQIMSQVMPGRMAEEPWALIWGNWIPDARAALADGLANALNISSNAKAKAIQMLLALTGDGQYAVRRASYRGLARQSPASLQALCITWSRASTLELRQRAAEAWAWLPTEGEQGEVSVEVYQWLATDNELVVRETIERTWQERRKRQWTEEYLPRIRSVTGQTNDEVLAGWCYAEAIKRVGDDSSIQLLRTDLRTRVLPPHIRYWYQQIIEETSEGWQQAISKWPQPWRAWAGTIEENQGTIILPNGQSAAANFSLWYEPAVSPLQVGSWGGTAHVSEQVPLVGGKEITLYLVDGKQGMALIKEISIPKGFIGLVGQGPYPTRIE